MRQEIIFPFEFKRLESLFILVYYFDNDQLATRSKTLEISWKVSLKTLVGFVGDARGHRGIMVALR